MNVVAVVGARLNSSRLPGKHLLSLSGKPMISHIWQRLAHCHNINVSVLATTADEFNQPLLQWAKDNDAQAFAYQGDVNDLMARIDHVVQSYDADYLVYICGDCPLIDPEFIVHALQQLQTQPDYDAISLRSGVISLHEGMAFYSRHGWQRLMSISDSAMAREHVGYGNKLTPVLRVLEIDDSGDYSKLKQRISVDTEADYRFMAEVYHRWYASHGPDTIVNLAWVQQQLLQDQQLRQINAHVNQKKPDSQYGKAILLCHVSAIIGMGHLRRAVLLANGLMEQLSLGTQLHIIGEPRQVPWLRQQQAHWYPDEAAALGALSSHTATLWVIDLHPDHIDKTAIVNFCQQKKQAGSHIVALDKCSFLLGIADKLFIPSFFSALQHTDISVGWQNYLFETVKQTKKPQLLVLTGGSDALHYGPWLASQLDKLLPATMARIWVQGPYAETPLLANNQWQLIANPADLPTLIAQSQYVISCYGLSLFEAISAGAMTLLLPPHHLASPQELAVLEGYDCCIICHDDTMLATTVTQMFAAEKSTRLLDNAQKLAQQVDGINQFCSLVKTLLGDAV